MISKTELTVLLYLLSTPLFSQTGQTTQSDNEEIWFLVTYTENNFFGYVDQTGDTVIPFETYDICYTDSFKRGAIVYKEGVGFIAIDKKQNVLFQVFPFDNGPDYPSEGLFRIIENGKIGFADTDFNIVIKPQFDCAFPFEGETAKVSFDCVKVKEREHIIWQSKSWSMINRKGEKVSEIIE
jgi:hypothetical protein